MKNYIAVLCLLALMGCSSEEEFRLPQVKPSHNHYRIHADPGKGVAGTTFEERLTGQMGITNDMTAIESIRKVMEENQ